MAVRVSDATDVNNKVDIPRISVNLTFRSLTISLTTNQTGFVVFHSSSLNDFVAGDTVLLTVYDVTQTM